VTGLQLGQLSDAAKDELALGALTRGIDTSKPKIWMKPPTHRLPNNMPFSFELQSPRISGDEAPEVAK